MGGVCGWGFGLAASCAAKKEKLRSWTVAGPGTEQGGFRESPYKTVGKVEVFPAQAGMSHRLNESPSEKEGKCRCQRPQGPYRAAPSMKALPKR